MWERIVRIGDVHNWRRRNGEGEWEYACTDSGEEPTGVNTYHSLLEAQSAYKYYAKEASDA